MLRNRNDALPTNPLSKNYFPSQNDFNFTLMQEKYL